MIFKNSLIFRFRVSFEWLHSKFDNLMSDVILLSDAMYMTSVVLYVSFYIMFVINKYFDNYCAIHYIVNLALDKEKRTKLSGIINLEFALLMLISVYKPFLIDKNYTQIEGSKRLFYSYCYIHEIKNFLCIRTADVGSNRFFYILLIDSYEPNFIYLFIFVIFSRRGSRTSVDDTPNRIG